MFVYYLFLIAFHSVDLSLSDRDLLKFYISYGFVNFSLFSFFSLMSWGCVLLSSFFWVECSLIFSFLIFTCNTSKTSCVPSCFSHVWFFATLWTVTCQALQSMGLSRQEYWVAMPSSRGSAQPRDWAQVLHSRRILCTAGGFFVAELPGKPCDFL